MVKDIAFIGLKPETARTLMSGPAICSMPSDGFRLMADVKLTIKKYITEEGLVSLSEDEIEYSESHVGAINPNLIALLERKKALSVFMEIIKMIP